jgi:hypothetical protein
VSAGMAVGGLSGGVLESGDSPTDIPERLSAVWYWRAAPGSFARYGGGRHHLVREKRVC